jgi:hypothetical protein
LRFIYSRVGHERLPFAYILCRYSGAQPDGHQRFFENRKTSCQVILVVVARVHVRNAISPFMPIECGPIQHPRGLSRTYRIAEQTSTLSAFVACIKEAVNNQYIPGRSRAVQYFQSFLARFSRTAHIPEAMSFGSLARREWSA